MRYGDPPLFLPKYEIRKANRILCEFRRIRRNEPMSRIFREFSNFPEIFTNTRFFRISESNGERGGDRGDTGEGRIPPRTTPHTTPHHTSPPKGAVDKTDSFCLWGWSIRCVSSENIWSKTPMSQSTVFACGGGRLGVFLRRNTYANLVPKRRRYKHG